MEEGLDSEAFQPSDLPRLKTTDMMDFASAKMRIIKEEPIYCYSERWKIKPYFIQNDTSDYVVGIQLGKMDYAWRIYKKNLTEVEILEWEDLYQR